MNSAAAPLDASVRIPVLEPLRVAWRIWTKGLDADQARTRVRVTGDGAVAVPLLGFVAIMA